MAFHLGFELPPPPLVNQETTRLTPTEVGIIKRQIRKNADVIHSYIRRIDLFVNREMYPPKESFIQKIRERMLLLMEENDTFRRLLWRHLQGEVAKTPVLMAP